MVNSRPKVFTEQEVLNRVFARGHNALTVGSYLTSIVQGIVPNHTPMQKFGLNETVGASFETVWTGAVDYVYISTATKLNITSSSTDDDASGTGALTVEIFGLDTDYVEASETITLDGRTNVETANTYIRIYRMIVKTAGSGGKNAGIIYAGTGTNTDGVPANEFARIEIGLNQTLMALFTIPANRTGYIVEIFVSTAIANKVAQVALFIRPFGEVFQIKQTYHIIAGAVTRMLALPIQVEEKSDIEIKGITTGGGGAISASFDLYYEGD